MSDIVVGRIKTNLRKCLLLLVDYLKKKKRFIKNNSV